MHVAEVPNPDSDAEPASSSAPAEDGGGAAGDASPTPEADATPPDAGADANTDAGECHARANTAPFIDEVKRAEARPPFTGGKIADGVYHRTESILYTGAGGAAGPTGKRVHQMIVVKGNVAEVSFANEGDPTEDRATFTLATSGTVVEFHRTCPSDTADGKSPFSATATELRIASEDDGVNVFTKQ